MSELKVTMGRALTDSLERAITTKGGTRKTQELMQAFGDADVVDSVEEAKTNEKWADAINKLESYNWFGTYDANKVGIFTTLFDAFYNIEDQAFRQDVKKLLNFDVKITIGSSTEPYNLVKCLLMGYGKQAEELLRRDNVFKKLLNSLGVSDGVVNNMIKSIGRMTTHTSKKDKSSMQTMARAWKYMHSKPYDEWLTSEQNATGVKEHRADLPIEMRQLIESFKFYYQPGEQAAAATTLKELLASLNGDQSKWQTWLRGLEDEENRKLIINHIFEHVEALEKDEKYDDSNKVRIRRAHRLLIRLVELAGVKDAENTVNKEIDECGKERRKQTEEHPGGGAEENLGGGSVNNGGTIGGDNSGGGNGPKNDDKPTEDAQPTGGDNPISATKSIESRLGEKLVNWFHSGATVESTSLYKFIANRTTYTEYIRQTYTDLAQAVSDAAEGEDTHYVVPKNLIKTLEDMLNSKQVLLSMDEKALGKILNDLKTGIYIAEVDAAAPARYEEKFGGLLDRKSRLLAQSEEASKKKAVKAEEGKAKGRAAALERIKSLFTPEVAKFVFDEAPSEKDIKELFEATQADTATLTNWALLRLGQNGENVAQRVGFVKNHTKENTDDRKNALLLLERLARWAGVNTSEISAELAKPEKERTYFEGRDADDNKVRAKRRADFKAVTENFDEHYLSGKRLTAQDRTILEYTRKFFNGELSKENTLTKGLESADGDPYEIWLNVERSLKNGDEAVNYVSYVCCKGSTWAGYGSSVWPEYGYPHDHNLYVWAKKSNAMKNITSESTVPKQDITANAPYARKVRAALAGGNFEGKKDLAGKHVDAFTPLADQLLAIYRDKTNKDQELKVLKSKIDLCSKNLISGSDAFAHFELEDLLVSAVADQFYHTLELSVVGGGKVEEDGPNAKYLNDKVYKQCKEMPPENEYEHRKEFTALIKDFEAAEAKKAEEEAKKAEEEKKAAKEKAEKEHRAEFIPIVSKLNNYVFNNNNGFKVPAELAKIIGSVYVSYVGAEAKAPKIGSKKFDDKADYDEKEKLLSAIDSPVKFLNRIEKAVVDHQDELLQDGKSLKQQIAYNLRYTVYYINDNKEGRVIPAEPVYTELPEFVKLADTPKTEEAKKAEEEAKNSLTLEGLWTRLRAVYDDGSTPKPFKTAVDNAWTDTPYKGTRFTDDDVKSSAVSVAPDVYTKFLTSGLQGVIVETKATSEEHAKTAAKTLWEKVYLKKDPPITGGDKLTDDFKKLLGLTDANPQPQPQQGGNAQQTGGNAQPTGGQPGQPGQPQATKTPPPLPTAPKPPVPGQKGQPQSNVVPGTVATTPGPNDKHGDVSAFQAWLNKLSDYVDGNIGTSGKTVKDMICQSVEVVYKRLTPSEAVDLTNKDQIKNLGYMINPANFFKNLEHYIANELITATTGGNKKVATEFSHELISDQANRQIYGSATLSGKMKHDADFLALLD